VRDHAAVGDDDRVSAYILEINAIFVRDTDAVGYGVDERGREFVVTLALGLAADIATALNSGRRPIVAVETPLGSPTSEQRGVFDQVGPAKRQALEGPNAQPGGLR
jgi:hypothetical protein